MTCKHHPDYDPASGEPTGETPLQARATNKGRENCKDCWQVRAKWLGQQPAYPHEEMAIFQKRIAKLEKQLAELNAEGESYRLAHENFLNLLDEAEKREAVLEKQLAEALELTVHPLDARKAITILEKREAVLREALEFYADPDTYLVVDAGRGNHYVLVYRDMGKKARAALEGE